MGRPRTKVQMTPEERAAVDRERDYLRDHIFGTTEQFETAAKGGPCFCCATFKCTRCVLLRQVS